jgi:hypothetical protein
VRPPEIGGSGSRLVKVPATNEYVRHAGKQSIATAYLIHNSPVPTEKGTLLCHRASLTLKRVHLLKRVTAVGWQSLLGNCAGLVCRENTCPIAMIPRHVAALALLLDGVGKKAERRYPNLAGKRPLQGPSPRTRRLYPPDALTTRQN